MTRYDFRVRRNLFKDNSIQRHKDFDRFVRHYRSQKRAGERLRYIAWAGGAILLILLVLFTTRMCSF